MFHPMLWVLCISVKPLFPQIFFSPRNVAIRIQQALDILHSEVCFHLFAPPYNLTACEQVVNTQTPYKLFVLHYPGASCHRQSGGAVKHCTAA